MIYIYNDFGGTHTTSMAAAYHLKLLPMPANKLTKNEILQIPYFNQLTKKETGKIIYHGTDEDENPVYTIGRRSSKYVIPSLKDLSMILMQRYGIEEKIIISNTSPTVPPAMTMGGLFSRELKIDFIGVPLLIKGAQQCQESVYQLVQQTIKKGKVSNQKVTVLENKEYQYHIL